MYIPISTDTNFGNDILNLARRGTIKLFTDATYEPIFSKNTAFNKDFGGNGSATTVAHSDHNHSGIYEPAFSKNTAFNKDFAGSGSATTVARSDHNHSGTYEPIFSKNTAFNKDFGTGATEVATGNHLHSGTYEPVFSKNTAFNKKFAGSGSATTVSRSDHNHTFLNLSDTPSSYPSTGLQKLVYETHSGLNFANIYYTTIPDTRLMFRNNISGTDVDTWWNKEHISFNYNNNVSNINPYVRLYAKQGTGTSEATFGNWADNYAWLSSLNCNLYIGPETNHTLYLRINGNTIGTLTSQGIKFHKDVYHTSGYFKLQNGPAFNNTVTSIRASGSASDSAIATEKAIRDIIESHTH